MSASAGKDYQAAGQLVPEPLTKTENGKCNYREAILNHRDELEAFITQLDQAPTDIFACSSAPCEFCL